jgi:hypothetical protein
MDNVYEVFTTPREQTGLQGIHFRFFPDMAQVQHALQVRAGAARRGAGRAGGAARRRRLPVWGWADAQLRCSAGPAAGAAAQQLPLVLARGAVHLGTHPPHPTARRPPPAQLYKDAGVPTKQFIGVPVFQAEGLTVTTQELVRGRQAGQCARGCASSAASPPAAPARQAAAALQAPPALQHHHAPPRPRHHHGRHRPG